MENEEKEKALNAQAMFDILKNNIGNKIKCIYWQNGQKKESDLLLRNVKEFMGIECSGEYIPFIGQGIAITKILSNTGELLYYNPYIEDGYNRCDENDIRKLKDLSYGKDSWPVNNSASNWIVNPAFYESESDFSSIKKR